MKYILLLCLCALSFLAEAQDCKEVQRGRFRIGASEDAPETLLTRNAKFQIEEVPSMGIIVQFELSWTSACTYVLSRPKLLKGTMPGISDTQKVYVKITKVTSRDYSAEISSNFSEAVLVKTMERLR